RWYGFDDATYTAARVLEILSRTKNPSRVLNSLPTSFSTPEQNVPCAEGEPARVVQALQARVAEGSLKFPGGEVGTIDGVRVDFADGFGLIRGSNTTPVLVLRFEGHTEAALHRIETEMLALLRTVKPDARVGASAH
ncbi:MAG: phosphomannomutase/phosphoglucomutase, partial [Limnohabitans sp.]